MTPNEILSSVHSYYNDAFNSLLVVVGIILGFAGVVFPVGIAILQSRQHRREASLAREKIETEITSAIRQIEDRLREDQAKALTAFAERSDALVKELKGDVEKKLWAIEAGTFHIQASSSKHPIVKVRSAADAVNLYCIGGDHMNLQRVAKVLLKALAELNQEKLKNRADVVSSIDTAIEALKGNNTNGIFHDLIADIERALADAKDRLPSSADVSADTASDASSG